MAVFVYTFCQPIPKKSSRDYLSLPRATAGRLHPWYPCQLLDDKGLAPCRSGGAPSGACCLHRFLYCAEWRRDMRTLRDCCPLFWLVVPGTRTRASRTLFLSVMSCLYFLYVWASSTEYWYVFFLPLLKLACKRNNTRFETEETGRN